MSEQRSSVDSAERRQTVAMRLCEAERLHLKPDTLYLFDVDPGCASCLQAAAAASDVVCRVSLSSDAPQHPGTCPDCGQGLILQFCYRYDYDGTPHKDRCRGAASPSGAS